MTISELLYNTIRMFKHFEAARIGAASFAGPPASSTAWDTTCEPITEAAGVSRNSECALAAEHSNTTAAGSKLPIPPLDEVAVPKHDGP